MITTQAQHDPRLARDLILDELFDLTLYQSLRKISGRDLQPMLDELIAIETQHLAFWQKFFNSAVSGLDFPRRFRLRLIVLACRLFGATAVHMVLEAIEIYGVRKYLSVWEQYKDGPLGAAVRGILEDEFKHEDEIVSRMAERKINPDRIRNIFLGFNDGLVEIIGAVSGFFAALGAGTLVLIAGLTTAVAGSLSMAAGAYVAVNSENEVRRTERGRARFLTKGGESEEPEDSSIRSAIIVGGSYFAGAAIPILPVLFGAKTAMVPVFSGGVAAILVSMILAFLSGMDVRKRIMMNLAMVAGAVGITYGIGLLVRAVFGVPV
ncbi:MAG TPA: VIT1/CCC1 transporter family protein [Nitrospiria bacterium]|nr:VIT1/CCC1 transporter family protein [Nitrospiria bacterium]